MNAETQIKTMYIKFFTEVDLNTIKKFTQVI